MLRVQLATRIILRLDKIWAPYQIGVAPRVRPLQSVEGLGDRLRLIAFAERQAHYAFLEAAERFSDAPVELINAWKWVAVEEAKHESWLLKRLSEIGQDVAAVAVNLNLYHSFAECKSAKDFALYISDAEERGRVGAERFAEGSKLNETNFQTLYAEGPTGYTDYPALG